MALFLQYFMLSLTYFFKGDSQAEFKVTGSLFLVTSFVYGSVTSLMPILCSQVFGPSRYANVSLLLQEQLIFMQRVQMAIKLYENYVFRFGMVAAIAFATLFTFLLQDEELVWSYSGMLVAGAYAIAAFSSFKKFRPDLVTAEFTSMMG